MLQISHCKVIVNFQKYDQIRQPFSKMAAKKMFSYSFGMSITCFFLSTTDINQPNWKIQWLLVFLAGSQLLSGSWTMAINKRKVCNSNRMRQKILKKEYNNKEGILVVNLPKSLLTFTLSFLFFPAFGINSHTLFNPILPSRPSKQLFTTTSYRPSPHPNPRSFLPPLIHPKPTSFKKTCFPS